MNQSIIQYVAAAVIVMIIGGFVGWYVFVRGQIRTTDKIDTARGLGESDSTADRTGSSFTNLINEPPRQVGANTGSEAVAPAPTGFWGRLKAFFSGNSGGGSQTDAFSGGSLFGGVEGDGTGFTSGGPQTQAAQNPLQAPKLWQITRTPVAGHGFASSTPTLYFAERASGNILLADPRETRIDRLTNTLFAKTLDAHFAVDGSVILRSIADTGEVTTFAGRMATSTSASAGDAPNKLEGVQLPRNIASLSVRPGTNSIFFLVPDTLGNTVGITSDWQGGNQRRALTSTLSNWRPMYLQDGSLFVAQKASDNVSGYAFRVLTNGSLERTVGNLPGLIILPKQSTGALLYSTSEGGTLTMYARARVPSDDKPLPIRTIVEKCVWAPGNTLIAYCAVPATLPGPGFLMNWYMGTLHTADTFWKVDAAAGTVEEIYSPDSSMRLDVERLAIDSSGAYLSFINATDKTLWMLSLNR